jgi:hypothetical protein
LNISPVSCAIVRISPFLTAVTPSDSSTMLSVGDPVTVTLSCEAE